MEALRIVFAILSGALVRGSVLASVDDSSDHTALVWAGSAR
jgi:hypothetical protein